MKKDIVSAAAITAILGTNTKEDKTKGGNNMSYGINLKNIPIMDYRDMLKGKDLLPSRKSLLDNIDGNFSLLERAGFEDAESLYKGLGSPKKLETVSQETGIPADYLTLLKRELGSLVPKVVFLTDFPDTDPALVSRLNESGLKNSKDVHAATGGFNDPEALCKLAGLTKQQAEEACALCDFVRVNGVAALFARILFDTGYRSLSDIAGEEAQHLLSAVNTVLTAKYSVNPLGQKDAQYCIDYATALVNGLAD